MFVLLSKCCLNILGIQLLHLGISVSMTTLLCFVIPLANTVELLFISNYTMQSETESKEKYQNLICTIFFKNNFQNDHIIYCMGSLVMSKMPHFFSKSTSGLILHLTTVS